MALSSDGRPPELRGNEVSSLVCRHFQIKTVYEDTVKALPGYDDRNYFFKGMTSSEKIEPFILKVFNCIHSSVSEIEGYHQIIRKLQYSGIILQVPVRSKKGTDIIVLSKNELTKVHGVPTGHNGDSHSPNIQQDNSVIEASYVVSILSFIPGELFDEINKSHLVPSILQDIGRNAATMDMVLKDIRNEALEARKNISWNLFYFMEMRKRVQYISDPAKAEKATCVLDMFEQHVAPLVPSFQQSIIQGDINGLNIVMEKRASDGMYQYKSFIDFSDAHKTCTVFELALCLAYFMAENLTPLSCENCVEFVRPVINGYVSVVPLTKEESGSLYYLVLARCIQSAVNGEISFAAEPWNTYLLNTPKKFWVLTEVLLEMKKDTVDRVWFG